MARVGPQRHKKKKDQYEGTAVAKWLRCCATNREVTGSVQDSVIGIFH